MGEILSEVLGWDPRPEPDGSFPCLASLLDFPGVEMPEECGSSYRENAEAKARAAEEATGLVALADDSGLEVDALAGAPGIHSARWLGAGTPQSERNRRIVEALEGRATVERTARFRCAVAVCRPPIKAAGGRPGGGGEAPARVFEAALPGFIAEKESGERGFGYDPIFLPEEGGRPGPRTLAEISPREKNRISHRARALRLAAAHLSSLF